MSEMPAVGIFSPPQNPKNSITFKYVAKGIEGWGLQTKGGLGTFMFIFATHFFVFTASPKLFFYYFKHHIYCSVCLDIILLMDKS